MKLTQEKIDELVDNDRIIYCFDIDNTIREFISPEEFTPITRMINIINNRYDRGHYIHLYTANTQQEKVKKWLKDNGVRYHEITFNKPVAHVYIDDMGINSMDYMKYPGFWDDIYKNCGNRINYIMRGFYNKGDKDE